MVAGASRCLSPVVFANKSRSNSGGVNWGFSPAGFELQQRHKSSVGSLCDFGVICYILNRSFLHAWQHPLCIVCFYAPRVFSLTRAKGGEPCRWPVRLWRVAFRALFGFLPVSWHNIIFFFIYFFYECSLCHTSSMPFVNRSYASVPYASLVNAVRVRLLEEARGVPSLRSPRKETGSRLPVWDVDLYRSVFPPTFSSHPSLRTRPFINSANGLDVESKEPTSRDRKWTSVSFSRSTCGIQEKLGHTTTQWRLISCSTKRIYKSELKISTVA